MSEDAYSGKKTGKSRGKRRMPGPATFSCSFTVFVLLLLTIVYSLCNRPPDIIVPTHTVPADNAYDDFVRAGRMAASVKHPNIYSRATPPPNAAYLALSAQDSAPALALLHSGLAKPNMLPPVRSMKDTSLRDLIPLRELARTAAGTARYYEQIGQNGRAADIVLDGYEMGTVLPKGGTLIAGLVGLAIQSICDRDLDVLVSKLSPAELDHVTDRLETISRKEVPFGDILDEEANTSAALYLEFLRTPAARGLGGLSAFSGTSAPSNPQEFVQGIRYIMADKHAILRENLRYFHAISTEARAPYTGPFRTPVPDNVIAQTMLPVFSTSQMHFAAAETVLDLLRIETALYRYRAANRHFPADLTALTAETDRKGRPFLAAIPADPFGGKMLYYSVQGGNSFLLYSVGLNLRDDHGNPQLNPVDRKGGDIVAGKMWPPRKPLRFTGPAGPTSSAPPADQIRK